MILHNIKGFVSPLYANVSFGKKLELMEQVKGWKVGASVAYLDTKRQSYKTALRKFIKLNEVGEYYIQCPDQTPYYHDDSIKILWKGK